MLTIRHILSGLLRFIAVWVITALALLLTSWLVPGITLAVVGERSIWTTALAAAFLLGVVNLLIRPLILLLAMPLGFIVLFVVGFFVNAIMLRVTAVLLSPGLTVSNWFSALVGSIVLSVIIGLVAGLLNFEDTGGVYESIIQRRLDRQRVPLSANATRGIVMLEIDGLSYHHIRHAIDRGYMPNVRELIERQGYVLSRTESGIPSMTSAAQAGILFGDNYDIPAFRWFDKAENRLYVSSKDAALINSRYAQGRGLLREGASVNNMFNGDAVVSLLTASDLRGGTAEQQHARARDVYTLLLNPNFFTRIIGLVVGEALLEVWQYTRDVAGGVRPRLNRLSKGYPLIRAATTVFMREVSGHLTLMQIIRGEPAIYATWPGYDEVAHHSGPWSKHALNTLRGYDHFIGLVREVMAAHAPRPYELLLLSDHGQSFGATFLQRYGYTLKDFIQQQMPAGTVVTHTSGGDDGLVSVMSLAGELGNVRAQGMGGRVGQAATQRLMDAAEIMTAEDGLESDAAAGDVIFCGSGNLAQVYFRAFPQRATLTELQAAYPGLVDAVVQHEGIGQVIATDDTGAPIAFSKGGARNLSTAEVSGDDPLRPYNDVELRVWQLRRMAEFPSSGELIVMGALYPDGTVAALEELIGNHGGLGGEQTDSFLLHPADLQLPPLRCTTDLFPLLNARRELPAPSLITPEQNERDDWTPSNLAGGLRQVRAWVTLALRAAVLDRDAYRAIAAADDMTGPAVLTSSAGVLIATLLNYEGNLAAAFAIRYGLWLVSVAAMHAVARILRGKGTLMGSFRVLGFAQIVSLVELLRFIPALDAAAALAPNLLLLFAVWLGLSQAHRLRGWRTLLIPLSYLLLLLMGVVMIISLANGFSMALDTIMQRLNLFH